MYVYIQYICTCTYVHYACEHVRTYIRTYVQFISVTVGEYPKCSTVQLERGDLILCGERNNVFGL